MGGRAGGGARAGGGGAGNELSAEQKKALEWIIGGRGFNDLTYGKFKDAAVRDEVKDAIISYAKEVGLPDSFIRLDVGTLNKGYLGMAQGTHIVLAKSVYGRTYKTALKAQQGRIDDGFSFSTSKPVSRTVLHELGHVTYNIKLTSAGQAKVGEIYKKFMGSSSKSSWGRQSHKSAEEFFAEGMAKSIIGKSDSYTKALRKVVKTHSRK